MSTSEKRKKRTVLDIEAKVQVIRAVEMGQQQVAVADFSAEANR
jgi:hypothetical protein